MSAQEAKSGRAAKNVGGPSLTHCRPPGSMLLIREDELNR